jgi:hypothetical protein
MSWRKFLPEYDVPPLVERLVQSRVLLDKTRKQDIVPHFEAHLADGSELVLWVDHPDPDQRALPDGPRYGLERYAKGRLPKTLFESDDLEETLLALKGILEELGGMRLV